MYKPLLAAIILAITASPVIPTTTATKPPKLNISADSTTVQSKDRDNPTKLTASEITGYIDNKSAGSNYYYSIVAGPGEVAITLDIQVVKDATSVKYEIFDEDARSIISGNADSAGNGNEKRNVQRFVLSQKVPLIIKLSPGYIWKEIEFGKFRLRFSGAIEVAGGMMISCLPKQGTLRVKMKDGSTKEIDLKQADEITVLP